MELNGADIENIYYYYYYRIYIAHKFKRARVRGAGGEQGGEHG